MFNKYEQDIFISILLKQRIFFVFVNLKKGNMFYIFSKLNIKEYIYKILTLVIFLSILLKLFICQYYIIMIKLINLLMCVELTLNVKYIG